MRITEELESEKNKILAMPFGSLLLESRYAQFKRGPYDLSKKITVLSPTLMRIDISLIYENVTQKLFLFKSKLLKEVKND